GLHGLRAAARWRREVGRPGGRDAGERTAADLGLGAERGGGRRACAGAAERPGARDLPADRRDVLIGERRAAAADGRQRLCHACGERVAWGEGRRARGLGDLKGRGPRESVPLQVPHPSRPTRIFPWMYLALALVPALAPLIVLHFPVSHDGL